MIEQTIVALLRADTQLTALVGDRIRPQQAREDDAFPLLVYAATGSEDPSPTLTKPSGWQLADIDVVTVAETYIEAQAIGRHVRRILETFRGTAPNGVLVSYITCQSESDDEQEQEGADPLRLRTQSFKTLHRPPVI